MQRKASGGSPVSVVGFACASLSCAEDSSQSSQEADKQLRSPVRSLLSLMLSHEQQGPVHDQEGDDCDDDYAGEEDSDCGDYEQGPSGEGLFSGVHHNAASAFSALCLEQQAPARTEPVAIPDKLWHKIDRDGQWAVELRRIQYERYARRQQQEQARVQAQLQAQGYYAQQGAQAGNRGY
uniref:Uncharacterized protein n=1 Tax=Chlamydomonas leiostraca TaxID=1034604 RepID=A0A7S0RI53_9CHLO|mmetsp:Transcript_23325/g.59681  ORF Transcript_23325/g.59681 Transcript_23325/m.59681 type:complete len:180 (+) Transcript_23325:103-642(+)|eukprot:CAMPEP_0202866928 /NCGR_PEP_ID=MMETSP1391-20130828/8432_1 /ASSEMBLY_ACC=CAM_ASM_000867 /TAXON_ID=1034604 /ORGANISM="Chlamydomonas leiostraca, Strain SAG 11-49" /LENGTH=179 /DNA_ID=CAMNT_0049546917 /DNA_START=87 /DNA_END=626 /DNA_ORIENTATION=+